MHSIFIVAIICGSLGLILAKVPASTIDSDLIQLNDLYRSVKKYSPAIVRRITETRCQMMSKCCPEIRSSFVSMVISNVTEDLITQCVGNDDVVDGASKIVSCSPLVRLNTMLKNPDFETYKKIMAVKSFVDKQDHKFVLDPCTEDEMFSIACDWDETEQQKSCRRKLLEKWAKKCPKLYKNNVQQTEDTYIKLINELKKEFNP